MGKRGANKSKGFPVAAAVLLAWVVPGLGHVVLKRHLRGVVIGLTIGATFWVGMLIGGAMTVDYYHERMWFFAQSFTGVHGLVGWWNQDRIYRDLADDPDIGPIRPTPPNGGYTGQRSRIDQALARKGVALVSPAEGVARAYSGVAGLLNMMCIFDVLCLGLLGVRGEPARGVATGEESSAPAGTSLARARRGRRKDDA